MLHINFIMTGIIHGSIIEFCFSKKKFLTMYDDVKSMS